MSTALSGAAVAAVSPWLVFFSVNARGYVWQTACTALLAFLVLAFLRGTRLPAEALGLWAGALTAEAPWSPRLVRSGRAAEPVPGADGALVRFPMVPCP